MQSLSNAFSAIKYQFIMFLVAHVVQKSTVLVYLVLIQWEWLHIPVQERQHEAP